MRSVKLYKMIVSIELYTLIPVSVTLVDFKVTMATEGCSWKSGSKCYCTEFQLRLLLSAWNLLTRNSCMYVREIMHFLS